MPSPTEPAAQPTSAPAPTPAAVTPPSSAPAPAGSNVERGLACIGASITNLVTPEIGSEPAFWATLLLRSGRARGAHPRERRQRADGLGASSAARGALHAVDAGPRRLPAEPAARADRLRDAGAGARAAARGRGTPRRPLLRWRDLAAHRGAPPRPRPLAHGERAARVRAGPGEPRGRRSRRTAGRALQPRAARPARLRDRVPRDRRHESAAARPASA